MLNKLDRFCASKFEEKGTAKDRINMEIGELQSNSRSIYAGDLTTQGAQKVLKALKGTLYRGLVVLGKIGCKPCVSKRARVPCIAEGIRNMHNPPPFDHDNNTAKGGEVDASRG